MSTKEDKLYIAFKKLISQCIDAIGITKAPTPKQLTDALDAIKEYDTINDKSSLNDESKAKIAASVSKHIYPTEYIIAKYLMSLGFDELDCYKFVFKNISIDWETRSKIDSAFKDIKRYKSKLNKIPNIIIE